LQTAELEGERQTCEVSVRYLMSEVHRWPKSGEEARRVAAENPPRLALLPQRLAGPTSGHFSDGKHVD